MTVDKSFSISLQKNYFENSITLFNLFMDGSVFKFTGADAILYDFKLDGEFLLTFNNRGTISGFFRKVILNEIVLEWNVEGFQRPKEVKTMVEITFAENKGECLLSLKHYNILHEDAALAKQRAWTEILDMIEKKISI